MNKKEYRINKIKETINLDEIKEGERCDFTLYDTENNRIAFEAQRLPYCCGVIELGNLYTSSSWFEQLIFDEIMNHIISSGLTIIVNIVDYWLEHMNACPHFKKVKEFNNPNSGNTIHIFISK